MSLVNIEKLVKKILQLTPQSILLPTTINNYVVTGIYDHFDNDGKKEGT